MSLAKLQSSVVANHMRGWIDSMLSQYNHATPRGQAAALAQTPERWLKAIHEMTSGYEADITQILGVQFDDVPTTEMVIVKRVPFTSLCEHHLFPFTGHATVAYIPAASKVVGLSKLARLVEAHAMRFQVQERMTSDIVDDLMSHLRPQGAAALIEGRHACMSCRGVRKNASMVTSALRGCFKHAIVRQEFLQLATS